LSENAIFIRFSTTNAKTVDINDIAEYIKQYNKIISLQTLNVTITYVKNTRGTTINFNLPFIKRETTKDNIKVNDGNVNNIKIKGSVKKDMIEISS
jgi:hypothetical protein